MARHGQGRIANRVALIIALDQFSSAEKELLKRFEAYDGEFDEAEAGIKLSIRRATRVALGGILGYFCLIGSAIMIPFIAKSVTDSRSVYFTISFLGAALTALVPFWGYFMRYKTATYPLFLALHKALWKLEPAAQSPFASAERVALAKQLLNCRASVRSFGSRPATRLCSKIIRQQAIRASNVFQDLVYLALLGEYTEFEQIRSFLAQAFLKIGTSNWVRIGDMTVDTEKYQRVKPPRRVFNSERIITFIIVVLTAIPALPVLIAALK